jgi:hypothetical protein
MPAMRFVRDVIAVVIAVGAVVGMVAFGVAKGSVILAIGPPLGCVLVVALWWGARALASIFHSGRGVPELETRKCLV